MWGMLFWFRYMDFVFGNETEAKTFSRVHGWEVLIPSRMSLDHTRMMVHISDLNPGRFIFYFFEQTENVEERAQKISQCRKASGTHKRITVITQGLDPIVVADDGKVKKFPVIKLPKENLADTNGDGMCPEPQKH